MKSHSNKKECKNPTVLISVSGGMAEYRLFPSQAKVNVIRIDWDNLKERQEDGVENICELIDRVKALPDDPVRAKRSYLANLKDL